MVCEERRLFRRNFAGQPVLGWGRDKIRKENRKTEGQFAFFYLQREGSQQQRQTRPSQINVLGLVCTEHTPTPRCPGKVPLMNENCIIMRHHVKIR